MFIILNIHKKSVINPIVQFLNLMELINDITIIQNGIRIENTLNSSFHKFRSTIDVCKDSLLQSFIVCLLQINKLKRKERILILSDYRDECSKHVYMMNCIFASQRQSVVVDSLSLVESIYLPQASLLTNGIHVKCKETQVLDYLFQLFSIRDRSDLRMFRVIIN